MLSPDPGSARCDEILSISCNNCVKGHGLSMADGFAVDGRTSLNSSWESVHCS